MAGGEAIETFPCFGGTVSVIVMGAGPAGSAASAAAAAKLAMLGWDSQFSRFDPDSELSRLNGDARVAVRVSPDMARFIEAALGAALASGGLVDPTLGGEIEAAGYAEHFDGEPLALARALELAPARRPASPSSQARWREVHLDGTTVTRPPGVRLDSGGIVKGLFGDILAGALGGHESFAIDCAGDVRLGGRGGLERPIKVASPFADEILHLYSLREGAVATSGVGKRSWLDADGAPAHHLLDPASGRPAYTGIVQVSAIAPSGVEAEWRAKAALLSGPGGARAWLPHGGLVVYDDARVELA
jgi:thiamine biosynthesis lipoprotein